MRHRARDNSGEIFVVKNTLLKSVLDAEGIAVPEGLLTGPTLAVFCHKDFQSLAKLFRDFVKESEEGHFVLRGAVIEGALLRREAGREVCRYAQPRAVAGSSLGDDQCSGLPDGGRCCQWYPAGAQCLQAYVDKLEGGSPAKWQPDG